MGCCFSKRSDPNEKDQADKSTKSLRMEITSPDDSQEKKVKKHLSQLPIQRTKKLSSSSSSPKTSSRSSSKTASIKGSYTFPPSNELNKDCLGKILKTPVGENFTTIKKLHLGLYGDILLVNDKRVSLKRVIKEVKKSEIQQKAHEKLNMKFQKFLCLDHPNILKLYEVYESGEKWSLVYELLLGNNLLEKIDNESIGSKLAQTIIRDILSGLNYCHRNRILHLGLNLEKIILVSTDGKPNCKITGFTFPWELEKLIKINEATCFMAPEILSGVYNKFSSDIWSAGVILYTIIQGKPPYQGNNAKTLLKDYKRRINFEDNNWILESSELKDLLSKMLEFDCNKRISAEDALNHPWVKNNQSLISTSTNNGTINSPVDFTSKDKLRRL